MYGTAGVLFVENEYIFDFFGNRGVERRCAPMPLASDARQERQDLAPHPMLLTYLQVMAEKGIIQVHSIWHMVLSLTLARGIHQVKKKN